MSCARRRPAARGIASLLAGLVAAGACSRAGAELPPLIPPPQEAEPAAPPRSPEQERLRVALERFEFGDYEAVVAELESLIPEGSEAGGRLDRADRLEALRAYGIACALVRRSAAAEGAFLLLLEADPAARLDAQLVRPEAVALFEAVRQRRQHGLLSAYRKGRGRRYAVLNFLPPAGQLQNKEYRKGYALLGVELGLLGINIASGALLYTWRGDHQDFPGREDAARVLRPVNWVSFGALIAVVLYGIVDGFVVGHRRSIEEREVERDLDPAPARAGWAGVAARAVAGGARLDLSDGALGLRF